ncbi:MAG: ABC transporter permease [Lentisphaerae bacterium]|nr:ABC transporter permease [Lentisphaerota bacterium]
MKRSLLPIVILIIVLVFLYLPIVVLSLNSFNASRFSGTWDGFTLKWYSTLMQDRTIWQALVNSLIIATFATIGSCIIGTTAALALNRWQTRLQTLHNALIYTPLVVPEILMGMSLLLLFTALKIDCGRHTILLAHITFCVSFVAMTVLARLQDFDTSLIEAGRDLGATAFQAFIKIQLPLLMPGIIAGGLLAFTLSVDDFVITFFVSGPGSTTLPLRVYSMIKHSRQMPVINALSTLLLAVTFLAVIASRLLQIKRVSRSHPFISTTIGGTNK